MLLGCIAGDFTGAQMVSGRFTSRTCNHLKLLFNAAG